MSVSKQQRVLDTGRESPWQPGTGTQQRFLLLFFCYFLCDVALKIVLQFVFVFMVHIFERDFCSLLESRLEKLRFEPFTTGPVVNLPLVLSLSTFKAFLGVTNYD